MFSNVDFTFLGVDNSPGMLQIVFPLVEDVVSVVYNGFICYVGRVSFDNIIIINGDVIVVSGIISLNASNIRDAKDIHDGPSSYFPWPTPSSI